MWDAYEAVAARFAGVLRALIDDKSDVVVVQDYQLMLVPAALRAAVPGAPIVYFVPQPFPSVELFRMLPRREALLRGALGADYIGEQEQGAACVSTVGVGRDA